MIGMKVNTGFGFEANAVFRDGHEVGKFWQ